MPTLSDTQEVGHPFSTQYTHDKVWDSARVSVQEHCEDRQDPSGVSDGRHPVFPDHRRSSRKARGVPGFQVLDLRLRAIG